MNDLHCIRNYFNELIFKMSLCYNLHSGLTNWELKDLPQERVSSIFTTFEKFRKIFLNLYFKVSSKEFFYLCITPLMYMVCHQYHPKTSILSDFVLTRKWTSQQCHKSSWPLLAASHPNLRHSMNSKKRFLWLVKHLSKWVLEYTCMILAYLSKQACGLLKHLW